MIHTIFVVKRNKFVIFVTLNEFICTLNTDLTIDDESKFFTYICIYKIYKIYIKFIYIYIYIGTL